MDKWNATKILHKFNFFGALELLFMQFGISILIILISTLLITRNNRWISHIYIVQSGSNSTLVYAASGQYRVLLCCRKTCLLAPCLHSHFWSLDIQHSYMNEPTAYCGGVQYQPKWTLDLIYTFQCFKDIRINAYGWNLFLKQMTIIIISRCTCTSFNKHR